MFQAGRCNLLAAGQAITPFAFVEPLQGSLDTLPFRLPSSLRRKGHGLDLHGVDPREPTHAVLIKLHRCPVDGADPVFLAEFLSSPEKSLPCSRLVHEPSLSTEQQDRQGKAANHGSSGAADDHAAKRRVAISAHH